MRHLHYTQSLEPLYGGGLGASAAALHRAFLASGVESVLYATHGATPQQLVPGAFEFRRIKPDAIYYSPAMHWQAASQARNADVLHSHGLYTGTNWIFGSVARRQGKPLVYHVQGMFEPYILQRSQWKKRLVHWLFEDANIRHIRLWRALTVKEADQIRACGYKAPIVVAPNGLDLAEYPRVNGAARIIQTPLIPSLAKQRRRVVFMARIHPKKGLDLLLPAWAALKRIRQDWELVIAGPDEQGYLSEVQKLSRAHQLDGEIHFTGTVTGVNKLALLHSADLFVLPSYSEGLPVTVLEAMACEAPVVVTDACNCPDIAPSGAGWDCQPTRDSFTAVLATALNASDEERKQRGQNGRVLVQRAYSWKQISETILQACATHC